MTSSRPIGINDTGAIAGDAGSGGFLRNPDGTFTMFLAPGTTYVRGINSSGVIAGNYIDTNGGSHGFLRATDGTITTFDVPGFTGATFVAGINASGAITGQFPGALGTFGDAVNASNAVTGY